jgi:hypothetical protein
MQSNYRRPHCHSRNVHEYSCVVTHVATPVQYTSFIHLPGRRWPLMFRPTVTFARGSIVTSKTQNLARFVNMSGASVPFVTGRSFDAHIPFPSTSALFPWVSNTHKTVYIGWKIRLLPLQHVFVGLSTSDDYLQASGGAYCNIRLLCALLVASFREQDCGPHEESSLVVRDLMLHAPLRAA